MEFALLVAIGRRMLYRGSRGMLRVPVMIGGRVGRMRRSWLRYMFTESELNTAVQLLSQIWPMESREPEASLGNACDLVVLG